MVNDKIRYVKLSVLNFPPFFILGAPEMLGGRVKTLHPAVHAGKTHLIYFVYSKKKHCKMLVCVILYFVCK